MRITLDALVVLDAIERTGSFAAAAEELSRVPSAVSYTIHKLERDLRVALFDRSGHRARLTDAGLRLLDDGRQLLQLARDAERQALDADAGVQGRLTIGVADIVPARLILPVLRAFHDTPGHERARLEVAIDRPRTAVESLHAGLADVVVGAFDPPSARNSLNGRSLGELRFVLVMPASHPLAAVDAPLRRAHCAPYARVARADWPLDERQRGRGELVIVNDYAAQLEMIRDGFGVGFLPVCLAAEVSESAELVTRVVSDAPVLRVSALWRAGDTAPWVSWLLDRLAGLELNGPCGVQRRLPRDSGQPVHQEV